VSTSQTAEIGKLSGKSWIGIITKVGDDDADRERREAQYDFLAETAVDPQNEEGLEVVLESTCANRGERSLKVAS
jgi:hypothetical protein